MTLPINPSSLIMELRATLTELDRQIEAVKDNFERTRQHHVVDGVSVYDAVDSSGKYILAELLIAKSQLLSSIASLQVQGNNQRIKR